MPPKANEKAGCNAGFFVVRIGVFRKNKEKGQFSQPAFCHFLMEF